MEYIFESFARDLDEHLRVAEESTEVPVPSDEEWRFTVLEAIWPDPPVSPLS